MVMSTAMESSSARFFAASPLNSTGGRPLAGHAEGEAARRVPGDQVRGQARQEGVAVVQQAQPRVPRQVLDVELRQRD